MNKITTTVLSALYFAFVIFTCVWWFFFPPEHLNDPKVLTWMWAPLATGCAPLILFRNRSPALWIWIVTVWGVVIFMSAIDVFPLSQFYGGAPHTPDAQDGIGVLLFGLIHWGALIGGFLIAITAYFLTKTPAKKIPTDG